MARIISENLHRNIDLVLGSQVTPPVSVVHSAFSQNSCTVSGHRPPRLVFPAAMGSVATVAEPKLSLLPNGMRVVLCPDAEAGVVSVAVSYDVGSRSEPADRAGFAHLFEHLMFQGSVNFARGVHTRRIQGLGGTFNGITQLDHTDYYQAVPEGALAEVLALEADRMRHPLITEDALRNQVAVVAHEARAAVQGLPFGNFPHVPLARVLFDTFANTHDGYGSVETLSAATVGDAEDFFHRCYAPGNAALAIAGSFRLDEAEALVERYFGDIPARPVPEPADLGEADLPAERRVRHRDPRAPAPAFASGWRVPDPIRDVHGYLPFVVLAAVLGFGQSARLPARLVQRDSSALSVGCSVGLSGDPFGLRDPSGLTISAVLTQAQDVDKAIAATEEELERVACEGLAPGELATIQRALCAQLLRAWDSVTGRARQLSVFALQRHDVSLIGRLPELLRAVTPEEISAAAATLVPARRATVEIAPMRQDAGSAAAA